MAAHDDIPAWLASLPPEWTQGCPEPVFYEAREAYRSPGRHYHTWDHVADCVEKLRDVPCESPRAAFLALVFHDAVYVAGRTDNEEQSAVLALDVITEHAPSVPQGELDLIAQAIRATQSHRAPYEAPPAVRMVLDIDMSILGAAPAAYDAYRRAIEREWCPSVVTPLQFAAGRMVFLKQLVRRESIYATDYGRMRWQEAALGNISRELTRLRERRGPLARLLGWVRGFASRSS